MEGEGLIASSGRLPATSPWRFTKDRGSPGSTRGQLVAAVSLKQVQPVRLWVADLHSIVIVVF